MDFIDNENGHGHDHGHNRGLLLKRNVDIFSCHSSMRDIIEGYIEKAEKKTEEDAFYIVDLGELTRSYMRWTRLLPNVKPFYAIKCNPNPLMLEALSQLGCSFDCASEDEIQKVLEITGDPSRILFANPCKIPSHIRYAQKNNVMVMTFDCVEELHKIKLYHPHSRLIMRLAVDDSQSVCKFNIKFGCYEDEMEELIRLTKRLQLDLIGFSFHVGSGCSSAEVYYDAIRACRLATNIATELGIPISIIDLGGGFPGKQKEVGFEEIAQRINEGLSDFFHEEIVDDIIEIIAEPGRYFAERTHTLVLNIIGKKEMITENGERTFKYYLNDGIYGPFNCIYFDHANPVLIPLNQDGDGETLYECTVFGPTCDSVDKIAEDVLLPELFIGEWVYVRDFGAYTVASSSAFNGFKTRNFKYIFRGKN